MANATDNLTLYPFGAGGRKMNIPVDGGSHVYEGTFIAQLDGTGMAVPGSTASAGPAIGMSHHETDNTGSDGDKRLEIETDRIFIVKNGAGGDACSEATLIGSTVYMLDDHTVADNDNGGTLKPAGTFMGMEPDGRVRVFVSAARAHPAADVGALTFAAVAGVANTTLEALPNPADAPATADALRDDIVANLLPALRNNAADLATQINAIRTALRVAGLMA